jgi:RNA polymerase sigma factor (sigma-70 family)
MEITKDTIVKAAKGDARSMRAVINQYTPLVHKLVNKYAFMAPKHSRDDLVQEGFIGLVKAIRKYDPERPTCFMTVAFPSVRGAVQGMARRENRNPKYPLSLEQSDWAHNLEDTARYEVKDDVLSEQVRDIVLVGCGSLESKQASIVCDRFGLLGKKPMRQGEVAEKYGLTKQAVNSYLARFHRKVREKRPELAELI